MGQQCGTKAQRKGGKTRRFTGVCSSWVCLWLHPFSLTLQSGGVQPCVLRSLRSGSVPWGGPLRCPPISSKHTSSRLTPPGSFPPLCVCLSSPGHSEPGPGSSPFPFFSIMWFSLADRLFQLCGSTYYQFCYLKPSALSLPFCILVIHV